jgi:tetratricopeptide (TPR) repeat protein
MSSEYGWVLCERRLLDDAQRAFDRSLELHAAAGRRDARAGVLGNYSNVLFARGDVARAEEMCREAAQLAEVAHRPDWQANNLYGLSRALHELGREREAGDVAQQARDIPSPHDRGLHGNLANMIGSIARADGRHDDAEREYKLAIELFTAVGMTTHRAIALGNLGTVAHARGFLSSADRSCTAAIRDLAGTGFTLAVALTQRAAVRTERREYTRAARDLERAIALTIETGHVRRQGFVRIALAKLAEEQRDLDGARAHYAEAEQTFGTPTGRYATLLYCASAGAHADAGDPVAAETMLARAVEAWPVVAETTESDAIGIRSARAVYALSGARISLARGDRAGARRTLDREVERSSAEIRRLARRLRARLR